jgi:RNA polymerase sigma-70 factor (ECF subfamily)
VTIDASPSSHPENRGDQTSAKDIFATTHWTVVLAAGNRHAPQADRALEELCQIYWYPLYVYVRHQGHSKQDAEDLTQGFFESFLKRNYLDGLSSDKGRFRAFLLAALKHYLSNQRDRESRLKRGGGEKPLSLNWENAESRYQIEPLDRVSPDKLYDRAWANTLLEKVISRLSDESRTEGKRSQFERLKPFLMVGKAAIPYAETARELGLGENAVRVAVHRLRRRYRQLLREEISQTLSDPALVEDELQSLFSAFSD